MNGGFEKLNLTKGLKGQFLLDENSRIHYSTDGSIFQIKPQGIYLPGEGEDLQYFIKKLVDENKKGNRISLTARGKGTDLSGSPLNQGIIIRFPSYLDKILEIGDDFIRVQPGAIFGDIQKELAKRGKYIPPNPASGAFCTIGGMVANNAAGTKTVKYGSIRDYVLALRIILSDGREYEFRALDKNELASKLSQSNSEGELYRQIKTLLDENREIISAHIPYVTKNASGYPLWEIERDGYFNLAQLFVGSEGTLGIISEITLRIVSLPAETSVMLGYFDNLKKAGEAVVRVLSLNPSGVEMVDKNLINIIQREKPQELEGLLPERKPEIILLVEFDGRTRQELEWGMRKTKKILGDLAFDFKEAYDKEQQARLWRVRKSAAVVIHDLKGRRKAIPFVEDGTVSPRFLPEYISRIYQILAAYEVEFAVWGHAGNGDLHIRPLLDLGDPQDVKKIFQIAPAFFEAVSEFKGSASGEHGDGLSRTPFLNLTFGDDMVRIFSQVKRIFDPLNVFNPYKKTGENLEMFRSCLRDNYDLFEKPKKIPHKLPLKKYES